jgi:hypothetical protein
MFLLLHFRQRQFGFFVLIFFFIPHNGTVIVYRRFQFLLHPH